MLDFAYFEKKYKLIATDLSKQKGLDTDPKAILQIIFTGKTDKQIRVYYIPEQSKKNRTRIFQRNNKSFLININGWT